MRPIVESFPFFCIFLAIVLGIVSAVVRDGRTAYRLSLCAAITSAVMSAVLLRYLVQNNLTYVYNMGRYPAPFGNTIQAGPLQALMALAFSAVMALSLMGGKRDLFHDILPKKLHLNFVMTDLLLASLLAFCYINDLFTAYVFIEICTISGCALVMVKDTGNNLVATIRYLFISLIGSGLFLIGVALLYSITGYLLMPQLRTAVAILKVMGTYRMPLAVSTVLIIIGLGIKSAMFPFHLWLPEAHGGATTASSSILSGLVLKGYIMLMVVLVVRVFSLDLLVTLGINNVILVFGILGMLLGSLEAMRENHIKRMLAYSSVAQIGYIFLGIGLGSVEGIVAACFHILVHACSKPLLFSCAGRLSAVSGHHKSFRNLRGSGYRDPLAGTGMIVGAFSMIGIPLFGGFVSKLYFTNASLNSDKMVLNLLVIAVSSVLNALYYIPAVLCVFMRPPAAEEAVLLAEVDRESLSFDYSFAVSAVILILAIFILGIFYHPITSIIRAGVRML